MAQQVFSQAKNLKISAVSAALASVTKYSVVPLVLGASCAHAFMDESTLAALAQSGTIVFNGAETDHLDSSGHLINFTVHSGTYQWNADMVFNDSPYSYSINLPAVADSSSGTTVVYSGTGSLIVDQVGLDTNIILNAANAGQNPNLKMDIGSIEVKQGDLVIDAHKSNVSIIADKIEVGSADYTGSEVNAILSIRNPQDAVIGDGNTKIILNSGSQMQMSGYGVNTIRGEIESRGGLLYVFSDLTVTAEDKELAGSSSSSSSSSGADKVFNMQLWGEAEDLDFYIGAGSTVVFGREDDDDTYHSHEELLHVKKGDITIESTSLSAYPTTLKVADGTFWLDDGVNLKINRFNANNMGQSLKVVLEQNGTLKTNFSKVLNYLSVNQESGNAESQLVFNGGTLWATNDEEFDLAKYFSLANSNITEDFKPIIINKYLDGVESKGEITSKFYVANAALANSINGELVSKLDVSNLALITHNLSLSTADSGTLTVGNSKLHVVDTLSTKYQGDEPFTITAENGTQSDFYFTPDACVNDEENHVKAHNFEIKIADLVLDNGVSFNVENGNWHAHNLTIQNGATLNVGNEHSNDGAALSAENSKLTVAGSGSTVTIYEDGAVTFAALDLSNANNGLGSGSAKANSLTTSGATVNSFGNVASHSDTNGSADLDDDDLVSDYAETLPAITVKGSLTITGSNSSFNDTANGSWAFNGHNSDATILVTGNDAVLTLGAEVLSNMSFADASAASSANEDGSSSVSSSTSKSSLASSAASSAVDPNKVIYKDGFDTFNKNINLQAGATLVLDYASGTTFTIGQIQNIANELLAPHEHHDDTVIDLGKASVAEIAGLVSSDHTLTQDKLNKLYTENDYHILQHLKVDTLKNAVLTDVSSTVLGHLAAVRLDKGTDTVTVGGSSFNNAALNNGFYASTVASDGSLTAANVKVSDNRTFTLANGGAVKDVVLGDDSTLVIKSADGTTVVNSIKSTGDNGTVKLSSGKTVVASDVSTHEFDTGYKSTIVIGGDLTTTGESFMQGDVVVAGTATLGSAHQFSYIFGGGSFEADKVVVNSGSALVVGLDNEAAQRYLADATVSGSSAYFKAGNLKLNGASIVADPEFGEEVSVIALESVGNADPNGLYPLGMADGNIIAAKNSIVMVGSNASRENALKLFAKYLNNGSLSADSTAAITYIDDNICMGTKGRIIIDGEYGAYEILGDANTAGFINIVGTEARYAEEHNNQNKTLQADLYLGKNTVLAFGEKVINDDGISAVHFDRANANIVVGNYDDGGESNARIILMGSKFLTSKFSLFSDNGTGKDDTTVTVIGHNGLTIQSENSYFKYEVNANEEIPHEIELKFDGSSNLFPETNKPQQDFIYDVIQNNNLSKNEYLGQVAGSSEGKELDHITRLPALVGGVHATLNSVGATTEAVVGHLEGVFGGNGFGISASGNSAQGLGGNGNGVGNGGSYGNSANVNTAHGFRNGTGLLVNNEAQLGSFLWAQGVYRKADYHDLTASNVDYGVDISLKGVAIGFDHFVSENLLVGSAINVGSGDTKGKGASAGLKNEFNYYGLSLYSAWHRGDVEILADLNYVVTKNDIDTKNKLTAFAAQFDTRSLSAALKGGYYVNLLENNKSRVDVMPYAGLRATNVDFDSFSVKSHEYGKFAQGQVKDLNIVEAPVGFKFSHHYLGEEGWSYTNTLDLGVKVNLTGNKVKGVTQFSGFENNSLDTETELFDKVLYKAQAGFTAQNSRVKVDAKLGMAANRNEREVMANFMAAIKF